MWCSKDSRFLLGSDRFITMGFWIPSCFVGQKVGNRVIFDSDIFSFVVWLLLGGVVVDFTAVPDKFIVKGFIVDLGTLGNKSRLCSILGGLEG